MGKPAARLTDMHICPMYDGRKPHVGGPVSGPGCPTVLIAGLPAARMGDMCICMGPPDMIVVGSSGVMIGGMPAARMGDTTVHGGTITGGCSTVLIGEVCVELLNVMAQIAERKQAAATGMAFMHGDAKCPYCGKIH